MFVNKVLMKKINIDWLKTFLETIFQHKPIMYIFTFMKVFQEK